MNVPLLDLKAQYASIRGEIDAAVAEVFASQGFILGPKVVALEEAVAHYSQCAHGIGVSSGTDALLAALLALGIGPGDEVITTPFTFFATAGSIARVGATPVFVDIDPVTYNLNPDRVAARVTKRTKAVLPVHLYGQMAELDPLLALAREHGLAVIEDAAQAIGAEDRGRRAGSVGNLGCFSFFPSKNLGGAGDGGMVVTNDAALADRVRLLRNHGMQPKYYHHVVGGNFRLDALQAAVLLVKLKHLESWSAARQANARRYRDLFTAAGLVASEAVSLPQVVKSKHIFNQYVIRAARRDQLFDYLKQHDVATEKYYPVALHLQECFAPLGYRAGDLPESERAARETLALPIYPELTDAQAAYVVEQVAAFYK